MQLIAQIGLLSLAKYSANNNNYLCNICAAHFTFSMGHAASTLAMGQAFSAHTRAHTRTLEHTYTHADGGTRHRIYLCCIFVVAAVLAGFVNRKIDFIYTCVCVCIYPMCVCILCMCVHTRTRCGEKQLFANITHTHAHSHSHRDTDTDTGNV